MPKQDFADILGLPQKRSLAEEVVDRLREAIYSGRLAPDVKLREEMLADFLKVSRGPIREALVQLEREGLVIRQPNRGATVARLSREDLEEVYSLRLALEQFAVRQTIRNHTAKHLEEMQAVVDTMIAYVNRGISVQEAARLDVQFHEVVYEAAKHKRLYDVWSILKPQIHIFLLSRNVANPDFRDYIIPAHQDILDAIRNRDEDRAVSLTFEHLTAAYERILVIYSPNNVSNSTLDEK
jgi:DNA-binding GntR family transcriptional regulator